MKLCRRHPRSGSTTVEFALVIPILFLFFFGAFEYSRMFMVLHTVEMAAYEGARRGVVPGATAADAIKAANDVLAAAGIRNATVTVSPNPIALQSSQLTVEVQASLDDNSWIAQRFLQGKRFDRSYTLGRENVSWGMTQPPPPPAAQLASQPTGDATDNFNSGYGQSGSNTNTTSSNGGYGNWGGGGNGGGWNGGNWNH